jgi:hypothetical protein
MWGYCSIIRSPQTRSMIRPKPSPTRRIATTEPSPKPSAAALPSERALTTSRSLRSRERPGPARSARTLRAAALLASLRWPRLRRGPGGRSPPTLAGSGTDAPASPFDSARTTIRQSGREPHTSPAACGAHFVALLGPRAHRDNRYPPMARGTKPLVAAGTGCQRAPVRLTGEYTPSERLRRLADQPLSAGSACRGPCGRVPRVPGDPVPRTPRRSRGNPGKGRRTACLYKPRPWRNRRASALRKARRRKHRNACPERRERSERRTPGP